MKKILAGAVLGVAAVYVVSKLHKQGKFDGFCDDMSKFADKAKRNFKNVADIGKNQVEYIKDRIDYEIDKNDK